MSPGSDATGVVATCRKVGAILQARIGTGLTLREAAEMIGARCCQELLRITNPT